MEMVRLGMIGQGFFDWAMNLGADSLEKDSCAEANRLWMLAGALPTVPAGDLLAVVKGEARVKCGEKKVEIIWKEGE